MGGAKMSRKIFQIDRNTRKASVYGYGIDSKDISYSFSIDDGNDYMLFARYSDGTAAHVYPIGYIQWYEQESTWKFVKGFGSETFSGMIIGKRSLSSRTIDCSISDSDAGDDILNTSRISLGLTRWYMRYGIEVEEEEGVKRLSVASVLSTDDEDIRRIYHSDDGTGIYDVETGEFGRLFRGGKLFNLYSVVNQTKGITKSIEDGDDPSVWYSDEWSDGDTVEFCVTPDGNGSEKAWIRRIVDGRADGIYLLENDDVNLYFSGNVVADGTFRTGNVESISVFGDPGIYGYIPAGTKLKSIAFLQILLSRANDPSCSLTQAHEYISCFVDESSSPYIVKQDISIGFDPSDNSAKKIPLSNYKNYSTRITETFSKVTDDIEAPYVSTSWPPGKDTPSTLLDGIIAFFNFENEKIYDVVNDEEYTNATSYRPTFVDKKTGKAMKTYSGSSFTTAVTSGGSVKEVPTKITIAFWLDMSEMDTNPYTNYIVQYGNDTSVCIYGNSDGSIRFKAGNFYGYWYTTAQKNKMTHFCVVADSDEKYIQWYIDGVAKPKGTYAWKTSTQPGQSIKLNFGGKHIVDEVGIWDRCLTAEEVTELYEDGYNGLTYPFNRKGQDSLVDGIIDFWNFDEDSIGVTGRNPMTLNTFSMDTGRVGAGLGCHTSTAQYGASVAKIQSTDDKWSLAFWFKGPVRDGIWSGFAVDQTTPITNALFVCGPDGKWYLHAPSSPADGQNHFIPTVVSESEWQHYAVTSNGTNIKGYCNGELLMDYDLESPTVFSLKNIMGSDTYTWSPGVGTKIDEIGFWDRSLTDDEIRNLYRYGLNEMTYPFDKELPPVPTPERLLDGLEYFIGFSNGNVVDHGGEYSIDIPSGFYIDPVGMAGKCMSNNFDGNVEMESNVEYSTQHEKMTFAYWGKYEGDSSHYICQKAFHGVDICLSGDKFFITTWNGTTPTYNYLKTDLSSGQWHHMCVVITPDPAHPDNSGCDCFFDGAFVGHLSGSNFNPTTSSRIRIDGYGKGSYDEVGYWSRGFSREEVALLYNVGLKGMTYPFDREPTPIPPEPTPVPPSPQSSLLEGLDAFWNFSDGSLSSSVGTRTLEGAVNVPTVNNDGRVGDCIEFDGTTGTFLIDKSKKYAADIDSFTLSAWVQMTRIKSGATCIVSLQGYNDSGESSGYSIELDSGRYMRIGTQGPWISTRLNDCNDAGWHHVVLAKSGNDFSAFFDGTKVWTSSSVSSVIYDGYLTIGGYSKATPTSYFGEIRAKIDEVGVWTRALSDEEVDQLYQRGKKDSTYPWDKSIGSPLLDGILAFYPFDVDEMSQTVSLASAVDGNEAAIHRRGQPYSGAISGSEGVAGTGIRQIEDASYHDDIWMHPFIMTESSDMTVSAWFNNACGGAKTDLFAVWGISSSSWKFKAGYPSLSDATKIHTSYHTGSGESPIADGIVKKGWNHFCATIKAGYGVSFYINGVLVREQLSTGTTGLTANDLIEVELGTAYGPYFADEVGVWKRALTVNEIKELYRCGLDGISYPFERPDPASMPMMASFSLGPETDGKSFSEEEQPTTVSATAETSETGPEPENSQQQEPEWVPPPRIQYEDESDPKFNTMLVDSEPYEDPDQLSV